jgi:hypothetical protein
MLRENLSGHLAITMAASSLTSSPAGAAAASAFALAHQKRRRFPLEIAIEPGAKFRIIFDFPVEITQFCATNGYRASRAVIASTSGNDSASCQKRHESPINGLSKKT